MTESSRHSHPDMTQRCAGPGCGVLKRPHEGWWIMWTTFRDGALPVLSICPWDDHVVVQEGALPVCGELCAQKLQSQFMGNVLRNRRQAPIETA